MPGSPKVKLEQGEFEGAVEDGVIIFRGIPYASAGRFEKPAGPPSHSGVQSARARGAICPQAPSRLRIVMGPEPAATMAEACHNVSVFTKSLSRRMPVMVWIHGGAYITGGGEDNWYDGDKLAKDEDVVVVSMTYRLGAFGYLHMPDRAATNLGLLDQIAALTWVRDNIARFGGDPNNITVFGQSAGAHSIVFLIEAAPALLRRAIIQSCPADFELTPRQAQAVRGLFQQKLNGDVDRVSPEELVRAQLETMAASTIQIPFSPLRPPSEIQRGVTPHDVMIVHTHDDAAPFVALRAMARNRRFGGVVTRLLARLMTARVFGTPAHKLARRYRREGKRVARYEVMWRPKGAPLGATHCVELPLLLGDESAWCDAPMLGAEHWRDIEPLGRELRRQWAAFARTGAQPSSSQILKQLG